jgi:hypothetical protein
MARYGEHVPGLMTIHYAFAETEEGEKLASRIRYEKYKPAEVSNERWLELFGADVNNLDHMLLTRGLTRSMVRHLKQDRPGYLAPREEDVLEVAALIHDRGEASTKKGDVSYSDKTDEDNAEEMVQLAALLDRQHSEDLGGVKSLVTDAFEVVRDSETKLGLVFNTVERIGYMRTALRAAEHIKDGTAPDCEEGLRWIVADVFGNQLKVLIRRIPEHPPIRTYFESKTTEIWEAFKVVKNETFANYVPEKQQAKEEAFEAACREWYQWWLASSEE